MKEDKKISTQIDTHSPLSDYLDDVSGGTIELDHISSQGVKWYKVTNDKTKKVIKTNSLERAKQLDSNPNDFSWKI